LVLIGFAVITMGKLLQLQSGPQRQLDVRADREALVRVLLERISCSTTTAALNEVNGLLQVRDRLNNVIISNDPLTPSRYGMFVVRAFRRAGAGPNSGIEVQAAIPTGANPNPLADGPDTWFVPHPQFRTLAQSWVTPTSRVFPEGSYPCQVEMSGGCDRSCPMGSAVVRINPDSRCVTCAVVNCPPGLAFQGHDGGRNPICVAVEAPCPPNNIRAGSSCLPLTAPPPGNSLVQEYINSTALQCRVVENSNPQIPQNDLNCLPDEFIAGVGGRCVTQNGQSFFGAQPGGGPHRFPGYVNRHWPMTITSHEFNCYHFRQDPFQGRQVTRHICCKRQSVYTGQ
jgi:hypothetical protein